MIVYCGACLASMIATYLARQRFSKHLGSAWICLLTAMPMIVVAAIRYNVGMDYSGYMLYFEKVSAHFTEDYSHFEILYHLINAIVDACGGDYQWVFAICAVIFYPLVYSQILEDSPYPELSVFLLTSMGFCFVFFNAMRQMVGCAFLLFSMRYIKRKKLIPFLVCLTIATCFHVSCVVFLPMYWLCRIRIKPMWAWICTAGVALLSSILAVVFRSIIELTNYAAYLFSVFDDGKTAYVMMAIYAVLLFVESIYYDEDDEQNRIYYNMQIMALWVTMFTGKIVLVMRLLWVFGLPSIIALPYTISKMESKKDQRLVMSLVMLLFFIYFLYTVGYKNSNAVLPYQTIFSR